MDPERGVRNQGIAVVVFGVLLAALGGVLGIVTVAVVSASVAVCWAGYSHHHARCLLSLPTPVRSGRRRALDRLVTYTASAAVLVPAGAACAAGIAGFEPLRTHGGSELVAGVVLGAFYACSAAALISSFVDWYRIRPGRDGVHGDPPCRTPGAHRWELLTMAWLRHRVVCEIAIYVIVLLALAGLITAVLRWVFTGSAVLSTAIPIVVSVVLGTVVLSFKRRRESLIFAVHVAMDHPGFSIGDHISRQYWRSSMVGPTGSRIGNAIRALRGDPISIAFEEESVVASGYVLDVSPVDVSLMRRGAGGAGETGGVGPSDGPGQTPWVRTRVPLTELRGRTLTPQHVCVCPRHGCMRVNPDCDVPLRQEEAVPYGNRRWERWLVL